MTDSLTGDASYKDRALQRIKESQRLRPIREGLMKIDWGAVDTEEDHWRWIIFASEDDLVQAVHEDTVRELQRWGVEPP